MLVFSQPGNDEQLLRNLLDEFMEGASYNDPEVHNRFWAEDLIYTSSSGSRTTKADIMGGMSEAADRSEEPGTRYHAEEVQVKLYGRTAVVAFKLVAVSTESDDNNTMEYYNTGTFIKQKGEWRAVAWQATKIPE
ncbi:MAG: nuclear transport factor 2 family protein [Gracilimonas sp.]|nr:nuclear transport factor 2 family protein [Gracilimonas sp.]